MWDSNPNCRNSQRGKKIENFPGKSFEAQPGPLTEQRIEGISEESSVAADWSLPLRGRQATSQGQKARGHVGPRDSILHQTVSRLPVTNKVFLGSWAVDIHQESRSQRPASQKRHIAHLRQCPPSTPRKPRGRDQGGDKMHHPAGRVCSLAKHLLPEPLTPGKGTKRRPNQVCAFREYPRTGTCPQPRAGFRQLPCRATWSLSSVDGQAHRPWAGANPVWPRHCERSPHTPVIFVSSTPPPPTAQLNKWA